MMASQFRSATLVAALATGLASLSAPNPALAYWRGGVFIAGPVVVPGPFYYPPPVYYPPPAYYPPPTYAAPPPVSYAQPPMTVPSQTPSSTTPVRQPYGYTCYAGVYVCRLPGNGAAAVGSNCSCPAIGAPSYGVVR